MVLVRELVCRGRELACEAKTLLADVAVVGGELSGELNDRFLLRTWESSTRFSCSRKCRRKLIFLQGPVHSGVIDGV